MTFEASRKKQTLVLQPRGKPLYEEKSSFGLKMMQSMGWEKGNGLGKNQQGSLDFIQVRYKNNDFGLGFDGLKDNQWTETESNFDSLLKHLNNNHSNSNSNSDQEESTATKKKPAKSLEEQSKQSRARVHYKKFTRGKDVHKYSEKDLANIFGKKSLKEDDSKPEPDAKQEEEPEEKPETYRSDLIINTGLSIDDYFKQKRSKKQRVPDEAEEEITEVEEPPKKKSKRNKIDQLIALESESKPEEQEREIDAVDVPASSEKRKKNKKKERAVEVSEVAEEEEEVVPRKKKKSKSKEIAEEVNGYAESVNETKSKKKRKETEAAVQPTEEEPAAKKRKKSKVESAAVEVAANATVSESKKKTSADDDRPRGANAVYSTDVIQIPSHIANKISNVNIGVFSNSNLGDIVGYGMSEDVEIKVVTTKIGEEKANNVDKYALYNMDKLQTKRVNPRKIKTKLKKTVKSIQVI